MSLVVAVSAHPDDETIFAGGTLAKHAAEGDDVVIILTTRGEGGEVGDPPAGPKSRLGAIREAEMRCAAAALGAKDVIFLGFIDPAIDIGAPPLAIDSTLEEFSASIARHLAVLKPDLIVTHGSSGEYGHPQHVFTHQAVIEALRGLHPWRPRDVLTWMANPGNSTNDRLVNQNDPADLTVDIFPWFEAKAKALDCHRTQHAMIRRNSKQQDVRNVLRPTEYFHRWLL